MKTLTPKQQRFCIEYVAIGNGAEAYRRAYDAKNLQSGNARYKARDLLARVHVRATVERLREEEQQRLKKRYQVDNERVMQELIKVAFFDLGKLFDDQGTIKLPPELDQDTAAAIASIDIVARKDRDEMIRVIKIRMANKLAALDKIALMLGMYQQSNEQQSPKHQHPPGSVFQAVRDRLDNLHPDPEKSEDRAKRKPER